MQHHWKLIRRIRDAKGQDVRPANFPEHSELCPGVYEVMCLETRVVRRVSGHNETQLAAAVAMEKWEE